MRTIDNERDTVNPETITVNICDGANVNCEQSSNRPGVGRNHKIEITTPAN